MRIAIHVILSTLLAGCWSSECEPCNAEPQRVTGSLANFTVGNDKFDGVQIQAPKTCNAGRLAGQSIRITGLGTTSFGAPPSDAGSDEAADAGSDAASFVSRSDFMRRLNEQLSPHGAWVSIADSVCDDQQRFTAMLLVETTDWKAVDGIVSTVADELHREDLRADVAVVVRERAVFCPSVCRLDGPFN
jgi:hypothetical protein